MMYVGSFAAKVLGFFAIGFLPQNKPAPSQDAPAKPAEIKSGTTVIVEGKKLDKPVEAPKVQVIQLEGKKMEIHPGDGKQTGGKKVFGFQVPLPGQGVGSSANGVITIQVLGEGQQAGAKTEMRTVTVVESPDGGKPSVKTEAPAVVVQALPVPSPGASKVIKIIIGDDGKVIRTETQDVKAQQNQIIELQGVLKSVENATRGAHEEALKKAMEAVRGEKIEVRRIQVIGGEDFKGGETKPIKPIIVNSGNISPLPTSGTITLTHPPGADKLDAILKRLEKIEKTLEELKAKK